MRKRNIAWLIILGAGLIATMLFLFSRSRNEPKVTSFQTSDGSNGAITSNTTPNLSKKDPHEEQQMRAMAAFETPIDFWGKIVDEKGNPIPKAQINYVAVKGVIEHQNPKYKGQSDAQGLFSIAGIKGGALGVEVSKKGYYKLSDEKSVRIIGYGIENKNKPPSPNNPAIFILHKMGETEPLIAIRTGGIRVAKDGSPSYLNLYTGKQVPPEQGDLKVEVWTQDQQKDAQGRYPWKCRISVPNGGLIERKGQYDFVAPENGYKPVVEISMDQTANRWEDDVESHFFIKLKDENFARLKFRLITGGDHFFMIESYINPKPGNRNLEFDPNKNINNKQ